MVVCMVMKGGYYIPGVYIYKCVRWGGTLVVGLIGCIVMDCIVVNESVTTTLPYY